MEGILKFVLPEDEEAFKLAVSAGNLSSAIWEMDQWLRSQLKYNDNLTEQEYEIYEKVREEFHNIMTKNDVTV
jgi:hypothetical protein